MIRVIGLARAHTHTHTHGVTYSHTYLHPRPCKKHRLFIIEIGIPVAVWVNLSKLYSSVPWQVIQEQQKALNLAYKQLFICSLAQERVARRREISKGIQSCLNSFV